MNTKIYGKEYADQPPLIDLKKIEGVKIGMVSGMKDAVADMQDNLWVKDQLRSNVLVYFKLLKNHDHLSVVFSKDTTYFKSVIEYIDQYNL